MQATLAEAWLQVALGRSWRETLANAGVIAAAQDLAALHLSCFRKDGQRSTKFWDWFIGDPAAVPRFELFDYDLEVYARSVPCENMVGQANPELACYWNAVEGKLVSGPEDTVISFEMWQLLNKLTLLPRGEALLMSMVKFAEQKGWSLDDLRVVGFAQSELRKLIAEGCAKILSATVREELRKRAARVPSTSVESVIASFK